MNTMQLESIQMTLREVLRSVRSVGLATCERQVQTVQSLIGQELRPQPPFDNNTLPYVQDATYLFVINHEPRFVLDDWAAADSTWNWLRRDDPQFRDKIRDLRVIPVVHDPVDDDAVDAAIGCGGPDQRKLPEVTTGEHEGPDFMEACMEARRSRGLEAF